MKNKIGIEIFSNFSRSFLELVKNGEDFTAMKKQLLNLNIQDLYDIILALEQTTKKLDYNNVDNAIKLLRDVISIKEKEEEKSSKVDISVEETSIETKNMVDSLLLLLISEKGEFLDEFEFNKIININGNIIIETGNTANIIMNNGGEIICKNIKKIGPGEAYYDILIKYLEENNISGDIASIYSYNPSTLLFLSLIIDGKVIWLDKDGKEII